MNNFGEFINQELTANREMHEDLVVAIPPQWWLKLQRQIYEQVKKVRVAVTGLSELDAFYNESASFGTVLRDYKNVNLHRIILKIYAFTPEMPELFLSMFHKEKNSINDFAIYSLLFYSVFYCKNLPFTIDELSAIVPFTVKTASAVKKFLIKNRSVDAAFIRNARIKTLTAKVEEPITIANAEEPVAVVIEEPVAVVIEEPVAVVIEEPVAVVIEESVAVVIEEPVAVVVEEPVAVVVEEPIAVVVEEPIAVVVEEAVAVVEEAVAMVEEPAAVVVEEAVAVVEEAVAVVEEPAAVVVEEPAAVVVEEPVAVVVEEPVAVVVEEPTIEIIVSSRRKKLKNKFPIK
jgi:hypothetical protein